MVPDRAPGVRTVWGPLRGPGCVEEDRGRRKGCDTRVVGGCEEKGRHLGKWRWTSTLSETIGCVAGWMRTFRCLCTCSQSYRCRVTSALFPISRESRKPSYRRESSGTPSAVTRAERVLARGSLVAERDRESRRPASHDPTVTLPSQHHVSALQGVEGQVDLLTGVVEHQLLRVEQL
jgi:hypothetical protein